MYRLDPEVITAYKTRACIKGRSSTLKYFNKIDHLCYKTIILHTFILP